jgi:hypothetical protein
MATLYQFAGGRRPGATPPVKFQAEGDQGLPLLKIRLTSRQVVNLTGKPEDFRRLAQELIHAADMAEGKRFPVEPTGDGDAHHG